MEYISVREASEKWGISIRRVQHLCSHAMIPGAVRLGRILAIPKDVEKPGDGRYKVNKKGQNSIAQSFSSLYGNEELSQRIVEYFPFPVQVFTPDGTAILTNEAFLEVFKIPDKDMVNGKYNILQEPDLEKWGIKEYLLRAFQGETVQINDIKVPVQDLVNKICDRELSFESIFQNISVFPIFLNNQLSYVVAVFITSRLYRDREEIMKSKEYIESHWLEEFDIDKVAGAVNLSKYHFARLFKEHTGMTPHGYYQDIKLKRLQEKLCDLNLSISQAFAECGVDYNGNIARIFKEKTGMTPSQYQTSVANK